MSKQKIFQDSTQGYIPIDETYVSKFIDTFEMQRLKSVCQMGIRPIYSGATHDRFSHSMGVYNLGAEIYNSFESNTLKELKNDKSLFRSTARILKEYRPVYYIACLLHDIGHPAYSHTLEYLYGNDFINLDKSKKQIQIDACEIVRILDVCVSKIKETGIADQRNGILRNELISQIETKEKNLKKIPKSNIRNEFEKAQPHEMMSAYQILTSDDPNNKDNLKIRIESVLSNNKCNINIDDALAFIARMIIGAQYDVSFIKDEHARRKYSLRNCIISLLNGKIDADSIDYLNRNAHFAGYAAAKMDIPRLCGAFTAYYDAPSKTFVPCLRKSALAAFDWFVHSRNYEPRWLYAHHKIVYFNDFLIKYLMKYVGQYIFAMDQENWEKSFVTYLRDIKNNFLGDKSYVRKLLNISESDSIEIGNIFANADTVNCGWDKIDDLYKNEIRIGINGTIDREFREACIRRPALHYSAAGYFYGVMDMARGCTADIREKTVSLLAIINGSVLRVKNCYTNYILSPIVPSTLNLGKDIGTRTFYKSTDSDVDSLFKEFYLKYKNNINADDVYKKVFIHSEESDKFKYHKFFVDLLDEFETRVYRNTLLKSYEEFMLFIRSVKQKLGGSSCTLSEDQIKKKFYELIVYGGEYVEFENERKVNEYDEHSFNQLIGTGAAYLMPPENDNNGTRSQPYRRGFKNVFADFDGLVIVIHECKFKNYDSIKIRFSNTVENYEPYNVNKTFETYHIPFVFYKNSKEQEKHADKNKGRDNDMAKEYDKDAEREKLLDGLIDRFVEYINNSSKGKGQKMNSHSSFMSGKMVRDSVHGNIFIPKRFLAVIDCPMFQRLRDIKQLATADRIYPEATHTRFAHSLGVFHIMGLILDHFEALFNALKLSVSEDDKDALLLAALLHDIGHGPYSHVFEEIGDNKKTGNMQVHEYRTCEIIRKDPCLADAINSNFGEGFNAKVAEIIEHHMSSQSTSATGNAMLDVYKDLISSNLDADRMDYLMRDSFNTGEKFGIYDIQRLISAMELTEYEGKIRVAIRQDNIAAIEQFVMGRYNMYANVYYAPYKLFTEDLIKRICNEILGKKSREYKLYGVDDSKLGLDEYLKLNDASFLECIKSDVKTYADADYKAIKIKDSDKDIRECEPILTMMDSFLYRDGYERLRIDDFKKCEASFRKEVVSFMNNISGGKIAAFDAEDYKTDSLIHGEKHYDAYNTKNEILMVSNNGVIEKFSKSSMLFPDRMNGDGLWADKSCYTYFNFEVCKQEIQNRLLKKSCYAKADDLEKLKEKLYKIFKEHDKNSHIEIENKYFCDEKQLSGLNALLDAAIKNKTDVDGLKVISGKTGKHEDVYFDTPDLRLYKKDMSLRCRKKDGKCVFTVKKSGSDDNAKNNAQFVRNENEIETENDKLENVDAEFLGEYLFSEFSDADDSEKIALDDLKPVLKIKNTRTLYALCEGSEKDDSFKCEICLDKVEYNAVSNTAACPIKSVKDFQLEIELKSNYSYRVRLGTFSNWLCTRIGINFNEADSVKNNISKYQKALKSLGYIPKK